MLICFSDYVLHSILLNNYYKILANRKYVYSIEKLAHSIKFLHVVHLLMNELTLDNIEYSGKL